MEQFEKVCKGLQTAVDSDWMWRKADYIAMCCKDALALIRQQQDRIRELEAEQTARVMTLDEVSDTAPTVDAAPVKHGKWFDAMVGELPVQVCDQCSTFFPLAYTGGGHHYCPNCGAKMDLEEHNGTDNP